MNDEILVHHGIKGQRWGVRRFQNEDGTRTAAGKRREERDRAFAKKHFGSTDEDYDKAMEAVTKARADRAKAKTLAKAAKQKYKEERKEVRSEAKAKADSIRKNMSTGEKILAYVLGGPMGSRTVSNLIAAGTSKGAAYAATFLSGNAGYAISTMTRNEHAERDRFN